MSSLIANERTKYLATLINTVAATAIAAGVIAPLVALTYGVPGPIGAGFALLISGGWLLTGMILHVVVQIVLGRLRP